MQIHGGITSTDDDPTKNIQADTFIKHFFQVSQLKPHINDRQVSGCKSHFPIDSNQEPFTCRQTEHIIQDLGNSSACGPAGIGNLHFKHLGPEGIQALTFMAGYSYAHNVIPRKGSYIVDSFKSRKGSTLHSLHHPALSPIYALLSKS